MSIPLREYWLLLRRYLAPQRGAVLVMGALLVLATGLRLAGPPIVASFIDASTTGAPQGRLTWIALAYLGISVAQQAMTVLATYWSERVGWTATNTLRGDLADHLLRLDMGFHKARTPGELIERVDGDVQALANYFSTFVVQLVANGLLIAGVTVAFYLVDPRLGVAFTVFAIVTLAALTWIRRFATTHWIDDRARGARFFGYVGEALSATEDIRSSGAEPWAMNRFFGHIRGWLPVRVRAEGWERAVGMAAIAAFAIGDAVAYGLGGSLHLGGAVTIGEVYLIVTYVAMLAEPIETIRNQLQDLQRADASIARVRELFDTRSPLADGADDVPEGPLDVAFEGVTFGYPVTAPDTGDPPSDPPGDRPADVALRDVSWRLPAGRVLGVLGRTGSGKTTMASLLFRLYDPQEGAVRLGGRDVRDVPLARLRARVGLVTQEVQLFDASLRDNLTLFSEGVSDARLTELLDTLGLGPWLAWLPAGLDTPISRGALSAGEGQLVAFARVLVKDPGLVVLDEASSRLDPVTEGMLDRAVTRLLAGRTAVVIAHRLATLDRVDDVLVMGDGGVLEHGERQRLAADPQSRYARLRRAAGTSDDGSDGSDAQDGEPAASAPASAAGGPR